ncbi:MAG: M48 family metallopeptidase [Candidatus Delongbacteria bacterium]|jgi:predicted Zn-dependent protease|nr:M48 family metallopeptidase [Candidatus Delongbacteria bacterium]
MKKEGLFALVVSFLMLTACSTVPLINRKQVLFVPQSQILSMSYTNYNQFLDTNQVSTNQTEVNKVKTVGNNISTGVEEFLKENGLTNRLEQFDWEFNLVENDVPNAWCMPGGKVMFYSGILPLCQNNDGIAVVMGHEIGHAVARHGNERMSQSLMVAAGGMALSEFMKSKPQQTQELFLSAFAIGSQVGVLLPYSRKHEYEADKLGLTFMAMAGYDPNESIKFWERMMEHGGPKPPEFLSTHPADAKRIAQMKANLPEAMKYYEASVQKSP